MTLLVDAAAVVAMHDRRDPMQAAVERLLGDERGELVLPAPITAEIDHLLARRGGTTARRPFLDDLAAGRYVVTCRTGRLPDGRRARTDVRGSRPGPRRPLDRRPRRALPDPAHRDLRRAPLPGAPAARRRRVHPPSSRRLGRLGVSVGETGSAATVGRDSFGISERECPPGLVGRLFRVWLWALYVKIAIFVIGGIAVMAVVLADAI